MSSYDTFHFPIILRISSEPIFSARSRQILDRLLFWGLQLDPHETVSMDVAIFRADGKNIVSGPLLEKTNLGGSYRFFCFFAFLHQGPYLDPYLDPNMVRAGAVWAGAVWAGL